MSFYCARIESDSMILVFTCSFSAIICPFRSPGWLISSLILSHTILLKTSLSLCGSRFVPTFELHDNPQSSLVLLLHSCRNGPGCISRRMDQSSFPCPDFFLFSSANIVHKLFCSSSLSTDSSSHSPDFQTNFPHRLPSHLTTTIRSLDLLQFLQLPL